MSSPKDFLEIVKDYFRFAPNIETVKSEDFIRLNELEADSFDPDLKEKYKNYTIESDDIVINLVEDVFPILSEEEKQKLQSVAFGKINNTTVNAFCIKSNDNRNNYCIVINAGLLMLVHKYGKLILAASDPKAVVFCNRDDCKKIQSEEYQEWANELIELYKTHNAPVGVMVKLSRDANITHSMNLHIQELFILCHELGHFYNGDLENESTLTNLINTNWLVVDDNKDHEIEYKADLTGFDLLIKVTKLKYNLGKKYCLLYVAFVFDLLAMIDPKPSEDHPAPIDRTCNIIDHFFGEEFVEPYIQTYCNGLTFIDFYNTLEE